MANHNEIGIVAGLDVGNGYVKGKALVNGVIQLIDIPSTVSYTVSSDIPKEPTDAYLDDICNELDVTMSSKGISTAQEGRVFVGRRGIRSGESQLEFNIENTVPKSHDSLSAMLVLSSLAGTALKAYWQMHGTLPSETLKVSAGIGLALPIEDYMDHREGYEQMFLSEPHYVHVHNFEKTIHVEIVFTDVTVLAEGAAGQYAIVDLGSEFLNVALDVARGQGAQIDDAYTGGVLMGAKNTIGIDIGEGTTNFPVFRDGHISIESSSSIKKGYGTVLTNVVSQLRNTNYAFESRKALADFMLEDTLMPAQVHVRRQAQRQIDKQVQIYARDVMKEFTNIFRKVGVRTDVIYVYGGGANQVRDVLYPMLIEASRFDGEQGLPVIYLDSAYSRDLNRNGLFEAAKLTHDLSTQA